MTVFVETTDPDIEYRRNQFLKSIGGQIHVQCAIHKLPLIKSTNRDSKCSKCDRPEFMRCCEFSCKVFLCKKCFGCQRQSNITYISHAPQSIKEKVADVLDSDSDLEMDVVLDMGEPSELNLVDDEEDLNNNNANQEKEEVDDNMFDFVLSSLDPDIEIEEEEDIGNDNYCRAV